ncbi:MAG: carbonic anhydrase [Methylobacter sp.]|uniref:carbonic anhydrase n=1 Tax=Methylobacter sp. TaxID=2051955 RepID=UPI002730E723|nr:carbonic anhydrase [Methylobacter sp.]MDP1667341.1 carbonic anhydrase [Methylobacter sp.]
MTSPLISRRKWLLSTCCLSLGLASCAATQTTESIAIDSEPFESLIKSIKPGLSKLDLKQDRESLLRAAVEANVRWSMQQLSAPPEAKKALQEKHVILLGAVYELNTGRVRFLD